MRCAYVIFALLLIGCSAGGPTLTSRPARTDDTPFGGGFPPNQYPDGDPFDRTSRRQIVQLSWPEQRIGEPPHAADEKFMQQKR